MGSFVDKLSHQQNPRINCLSPAPWEEPGKEYFKDTSACCSAYQVLVSGDRIWQVSQWKCRQFFYVIHTFFFITQLVTSWMALWCTRISSHSNVKSDLCCYCRAPFCDITTSRLQWFESLRRRKERLLMCSLWGGSLFCSFSSHNTSFSLRPPLITLDSWVGRFWHECSAITRQWASVA